MSGTQPTETLSLADARWGWPFGCDGVLQSVAAAQLCDVTTRTLKRWAQQGRIRRATLPGGTVVYCRHSIMRLLATAED